MHALPLEGSDNVLDHHLRFQLDSLLKAAFEEEQFQL